MFTGIVERLGRVRSLESGRLVLDAEAWDDALQLGESIAVNGCCLTVIAFSDGLAFDLSSETLGRTSLGQLKPGSLVNLERAMRANGRFGGHIVQGHVDATGALVAIMPSANSCVFRFETPPGYDRYLIDKGSVTVDGISLTVVEPKGRQFDTWIIPHTLEHTNLKGLAVGDKVNLEFDVIAKYVERLTSTGGRSDV